MIQAKLHSYGVNMEVVHKIKEVRKEFQEITVGTVLPLNTFRYKIWYFIIQMNLEGKIQSISKQGTMKFGKDTRDEKLENEMNETVKVPNNEVDNPELVISSENHTETIINEKKK